MLPNNVELQSVSIYILMYTLCRPPPSSAGTSCRPRCTSRRLDHGLRLIMWPGAGHLRQPADRPAGLERVGQPSVLGNSLALLLAGADVGAAVSASVPTTSLPGACCCSRSTPPPGSLGIELFGPFSADLAKIGVTIELITLSIGLATASTLKEEGFCSRLEAEQAVVESESRSRFLAKMSHSDPHPALTACWACCNCSKRRRLPQPALLCRHHRQFRLGPTTVINDILDYARISSPARWLWKKSRSISKQLLSETFSLFTAQAWTSACAST